MQVEKQPEVQGPEQEVRPGAGRDTLELCFIAVTGVVVASAFVAALTYDRVSARAPLFVMLPLLVLIGLQLRRSIAAIRHQRLHGELSAALRGQYVEFNSVVGFIGWMLLLLGLIYVAGHYVGIAAFMFTLLRAYAKETLRLSLLVTVGVTAIIYLLFEHGFNIPLYRGLIFGILENYVG
ncbi:MAG: tripartite tricarboxylate transporter TctB family protein [Woeseia sp.]